MMKTSDSSAHNDFLIENRDLLVENRARIVRELSTTTDHLVDDCEK